MQEFTQLRMVSAYSKGSEMQFQGEKPYHWTEDAACAFQPSSLFELAASDSPISEGIALEGDPREDDPANIDEMQAIKDLNADNFKRAQEICNTCPVWHLCYAEADKDDFLWTVRAGILPTKYNEVSRGRPVDNPDEIPKECPKGHSKVRRKDGNGWYCNPCKNEQAIANRRAKGIGPVKQREAFSRGKVCKKGLHDEWILHPRGVHECWPCKQERQAGYYAKMEA